jgi:hypothetical protein
MKGTQKHLMMRVAMGVTVFMLLYLNLSGVIWYNRTNRSFQEIPAEGLCLQEKALKAYVIEGAGYFLKSYSDFLLFLDKVEMAELQGYDQQELQFILDNAIEKMQYTHVLYCQLKQKADATPYDPAIIADLSIFNYDLFMEEKGLLKDIFKQVKAFLSKGKIRELYGEVLMQTERILSIANLIREQLVLGELPQVSHLYDLNEALAQYMLFGEYSARVFQEVN